MTTGPAPHVGGPILPPGAPTVLIDFLPAATVTSMATCVGPPDVIVKGSAGVFINFMPAARMGDMTAHGGVIVMGSPNVIIGEIGAGSPGAAGIAGIVAGLAASGANHPQKPNPSVIAIPAQCSFLNKQFRVQGSKQQFDAVRRTQTLGSPAQTQVTFPGGTAPEAATQQTVTIGGHSVNVIQASRPPGESGTLLPSTNQVASSLGAIPAEQFNHINNVIVSPNRSPHDSFWAQQYNMPNFRSEADAGADGNVRFYPIPNNVDMIPDETLIHESGHTFSKTIWPTDNDWNGWRDAMKADGRSVSTYADSSKDEDFSESLVMYTLSKGTPCEATARALFPHRYALMEALLSPKLPDHPPPPQQLQPSKGFLDWLGSLFS